MRKRIGTGVVCLWIVASAMWLGGGAMVAGARTEPEAKPESFLPRTNVTVAATLVRLSKATYRGLGGRLIGQGDPEALVEKVTDHVQDHPDVVIAGIQVHPANHETNECSETQRLYYPRQGVRKSQEIEAYESGKQFSATASVMDYRRIYVEYAWEHSWFDEETRYRTVPPTTHHWSWSGSINMHPDKPLIVGSHLDDEHIVLLVLVAWVDE
jgi:hypothetical protein